LPLAIPLVGAHIQQFAVSALNHTVEITIQTWLSNMHRHIGTEAKATVRLAIGTRFITATRFNIPRQTLMLVYIIPPNAAVIVLISFRNA
jgi:hypothetical protein